mmetsp:Transcript_28484/g.37249  ORF Transcript_28484/g.37249 Transcript_28484/m.37249 type:complete len:438 (+) Transcript_28484:64-1377(+)
MMKNDLVDEKKENEDAMIAAVFGEEEDSKCMLWKTEVLTVVGEALQFAQTAVELDTPEGARDSIAYYRKAAEILEDVLKMLPSSMAEESGLGSKRMKYLKRVQVLKEITSRHPKQARMPFAPDIDLMMGKKALESTTFQGAPPSLTAQSSSDVSQSELGGSPVQSLHRPYWKMRMIAKTITSGEFLSPRLHIPTEVWCQVGVKLNGLTYKVVALESLLKFMRDKVDALPDLSKPTSDADGMKILEILQSFHNFTVSMQNDLSKSFPFIEEIEVEEVFDETVEEEEDQNILSSIGHLLKLNKVVSHIGKKASTAYDRIGASISDRVRDADLQSYSERICQVCSKSQVIEKWTIICLEIAKKAQSNEITPDSPHKEHQKHAFITAHNEEFILHLNHIAFFFKNVICELIIRDLEVLLERYIRKTRKAFVRMYWDEDDTM